MDRGHPKVKWPALKYWMHISLIACGYVTICNTLIQKYAQLLHIVHDMYVHVSRSMHVSPCNNIFIK
jgi:hypothetical protein